MTSITVDRAGKTRKSSPAPRSPQILRTPSPENASRDAVKTSLGACGQACGELRYRINNIIIAKPDARFYEKDRADCVFFAQHLAEIVQMGLWAGQFFVARRNASVNVTVRQRGKPQVDSSGVFGEWKDQTSFWGLRGPWGVQFTRPSTEPSHETTIGGSR